MYEEDVNVISVLSDILKELKSINGKIEDIKSDVSWIEGHTFECEIE